MSHLSHTVVPVMQSPSEHPASGFHLPTRLVDLLVPPLAVMGTKDVVTSEDRRLLRVLKKAKGLQPLQIELSWMCVGSYCQVRF